MRNVKIYVYIDLDYMLLMTKDRPDLSPESAPE
jgi:hypothetical protein